MISDIRDLTISELDAVSGGDISVGVSRPLQPIGGHSGPANPPTPPGPVGPGGPVGPVDPNGVKTVPSSSFNPSTIQF
jgi:hypothetical protein